MLRYIYADELPRYPKLANTMFIDRAWQFSERLQWEVTVDDRGYETDIYDSMNPIYVIWERPDGTHGGSMRYMPTTGDTMVNDHFTHLTDGVQIKSPFIWECTRFCQAPDAGARTPALLMLGALEIGLGQNLQLIVGVFDARMVRIYRRLGWEPTVMGTEGSGRDAISVGLWECLPELRAPLLKRAGVTAADATAWYEKDLGGSPRMVETV